VFPAESHEEALDRVTLQGTRTREIAERALFLTEVSTDGSGQYDANGNRISSLGTPTATTDATTKTYVDVLVNNTALATPPTGLIATGSITSRLLSDRWGEVQNVMDFGATGDGSTDDTTAIQAAATAAAGGTLLFPEPSVNYKIIATIILPSGITVVGYGRPKIVQSVAGGGVFAVTVTSYSNVTISGLIMEGQGSATLVDSSAEKGAIWIDGNGGTGTDIRITDCEVSQFYNGISVLYTNRVWIERNHVHKFKLYGVLLSRSTEFHVKDNTIHGSEETGAANSYGISATGDNAGGNTQQRCSIIGNVIYDIKSWDGIMSHDVSNLIIANNHITDVRTGIDVGAFTTANIVEKIIITGNYIQATTTDTWSGAGALHFGITVLGKAGSPDAIVYDVSITNNVVNNFNNISGAATAGNNPAAIGLMYCGDGLIANNLISDLGNVDTNYIAVSVYAPQHNISVTGNSANGTYGTYLVRVQHADGADSCAGLMIANNQNTSTSMTNMVLLHTGTYTGVAVTNNGTVTEDKSVVLSSATVTYVYGGVTALANNSTPPIYGGATFFTTGGTTTITDFDNGVLGQTITVLSEHAVTITDGTHIILHGSANFTMAAGDSLTLVLKADNKWYETARMVNLAPPVVTFAGGDATPTVLNGKYFLTAGTTAITDFDDGVVGQTITVKAKTSITITDGGDLELAGNFAMTTGDTITLTMLETGKWSEISRSDIA
jgi:hypothetical protein